MKVTKRLFAIGLTTCLALFACNPNQTLPASGNTTPASQNAERPTGTEPILDSQGLPMNCEIMVEGLCYMATSAACAAAECPADQCLVLESYPGQISCQAAAPTVGAEQPTNIDVD